MRLHLATFVEEFRLHGAQPAVVVHRGIRRQRFTYRDLADLSERFAAELIRRRIVAGDRVVLWGQNSAEWIAAYWGCVLRGVLVIPLDAAGDPGFVQRVIAETQPRLLVAERALLPRLAANLAPSTVASLVDKFPFLVLEDLAALLPLPPFEAPVQEPTLGPETPLQILFTSGTTSEPKGIVHTHRNVLASLEPIEREMRKYLRYERVFHPLRFLHTLPLSHVFGQFMGLWIPPLMAAEVHLESRLQAPRLMELIHRHRISVLAAVPRVLDLLKAELEARVPHLASRLDAASGQRLWRRWWSFRDVHRRFGFKFWALVCGGAALTPALERFWSDLGFALIQGYGMTETAALITLNHPFHLAQGTIGKPLPGREIRIGSDGEVLVRGAMVATARWQNGHMQSLAPAAGSARAPAAGSAEAPAAGSAALPAEASAAGSAALPEPWLATGDLVEQDAEGHLRFLGRKSETIVTAAGLNIHPEDVEAALNRQPGVAASAVVPLHTEVGDEPVAVLLFRGTSQQAQSAIDAANASLAEYQRVRRWKLWPQLDFPRSSLGKIQRPKITQWVADAPAADDQGCHPERSEGPRHNSNLAHPSGSFGQQSIPSELPDPLTALIAAITRVSPENLSDGARPERELNLDSLARVQLQAELEQRLGVSISDEEFEHITTLGELRARIDAGFPAASPSVSHTALPAEAARSEGSGAQFAAANPPESNLPSSESHRGPTRYISPEFRYPEWSWWPPVQAVRVLFQEAVMRPLVWLLAAPALSGGNVSPPDQPLLLIANHVTAYDAPLVLYALPFAMRRRVAIAMSATTLEDLRHGRNQSGLKHGNWLLNLLAPVAYWLITPLFNVFPLPAAAGFRRSFFHAGLAMDRGYHVLIFPEGRRSADGALLPFRAGIGLLAQESGAKILPIALQGLGELRQRRRRWFRSGILQIRIGSPIVPELQLSPAALAEALRSTLASLLRP